MSQVFVVVPSADRAELGTVFERAGMSIPDSLEGGCVIRKIHICPSSKEWIVHLAGAAMFSPECMLRIREAFRCIAGDDIDVRVALAEDHDGVGSGPLEEGWPLVVEGISSESPVVGVLLGQARCIAGNGRVVVEVPGEVQRDKLIERGCEQMIAQAFARVSSVVPSVRIEVGEFEEPEAPPEESRPIAPPRQAPSPEAVASRSQGAGDGKWPSRRKKLVTDEGAIRGRKFSDAPRPIPSLAEGEKKVVCAGEVFGLQTRITRNGSTILTFNITDRSDSISCKCFCDSDDPALGLRDGTCVAVRGDIQYDQFSRESVLSVADIVPCSPPVRQDESPEKRIELHLHTKMSAMDSVCEVDDVIRRAASWGHRAVAITDHGVVQSFPDAYNAGRKHGIKILYGMEGYLVDSDSGDDSPTFHMTVLARNASGLRALYALVSEAHIQHFHRHPRILRERIAQCRAGLLLGSACAAGELFRAALNGATDRELADIASFYDYLEIMPPHNDEFLVRSGRLGSIADIQAVIARIYRTGVQLGIPVVASGDVHFLDPDEEVYRRVLMAGQGYEDADSQAPLYLHTTEEMLQQFAFLGEKACREVVITSPARVADMVESLCPVPQDLATPEIEGADDEVRDKAYSRAKEIYGDPLPAVVGDRLERELKAIIGNGFAVNYDIAAKLVWKSVEAGYPVGSRGSVGSSFVATMCEITEVNPLAPHYVCLNCKFSDFEHGHDVESGYDLPDARCPKCGSELHKDGQSIPFEVFMGFEGDKVPDIDLNFSGEYQLAIHKYAEELFGSDHVFRAGTIATIAEKTAYGFVKAYAESRGLLLRGAEMARLARGCSGVKRTTGQHPGGVMIVPRGRDVHEFTPIQRPANDKTSDIVTTHFEYKTIHDCLLKLDLLGHDDPTMIKMLEDFTGLKADSIPMDDAPTMAIFSGVESLGLDESCGFAIGSIAIPEFGTKFVRGMLEETRPRTFGELVRISGLSHGTDVWLSNAQDLIRSGTAKLAQVIACRDDIMNRLIMEGLPPRDAFRIMERVRKGKGLTDDDAGLMRSYELPEWYLDSCNKIKYMFPKAHAAAYVTMAFRIAYFKVHFPLQFYAAHFSLRAGDFDAGIASMNAADLLNTVNRIEEKNDATAKERGLATIYEVAAEARMRGVEFLPVDIEKSEAAVFTMEDGELRLPLLSVPGLGRAAADSVIQARKERPFTSIMDLRERTKLTRALTDMLTEMGATGDLPDTDQLSLF